MESWLSEVQGAQQLFDWFGYWPSFHDAEVLSVKLERSGPSTMQVHTFRMTSETDATGHYACDRHCIVTLFFETFEAIELLDFNNQNVLYELKIAREGEIFVVSLGGGYGLAGEIRCKKLRFDLLHGIPVDSQYRKSSEAV